MQDSVLNMLILYILCTGSLKDDDRNEFCSSIVLVMFNCKHKTCEVDSSCRYFDGTAMLQPFEIFDLILLYKLEFVLRYHHTKFQLDVEKHVAINMFFFFLSYGSHLKFLCDVGRYQL